MTKLIEKQFGTTGATIPAIGQGTWQMPSGKNSAAWTEALRRGIELGLTHIDTAEMYGSGSAEELIAEAISDLPRESLFIVSKVLPDNASYKGTIAACEKSLKRLRTEYMDCYLLHWRGSAPLEDTMRALEKLVDDGKIRSLGVSNFDVDDLEEAESYLTKHKIACNQVLYNLDHRGIERNLIPYCEKKKMAVVGYSPFGRRPIPTARSQSGAVLHEIASAHNATVTQIILAFLTRLDCLFAIPKAATIAHVEDNAGAARIKLSADDIDAISAAFPAPKRDVPLEMW
jgi:diketogulonate reductase-like aldo/keto reductase